MAIRKQPQIGPPWAGWLNGLPSVAAKPTSFKQITNWLVNKGRLQSPPAFLVGPVTHTGSILRLRSFADSAGSWHTVAITPVGIEALVAGAWVPLLNFARPSVFPFSPVIVVPSAIEVYQNTLFFSGGPQPLSFWTGGVDAGGQLDSDLAIAGDTPGGCYFLGKLDSRLIQLNTVENQWNFPRRVRWSAINNAREWLSTVDPSAGATDIAEVEDAITGWSCGYNVGYVYRNAGISTMTPTGNPSIPFLIENYSAGPNGVGCYTPYTMASWGSMAVFRSETDMYMMDGGQLTPIGASAKLSILNDIEAAVGIINSAIVGSAVPGTDYLAYWLLLPHGDGNTTIWVYHFDDQSWMKLLAPPLANGQSICCVEGIFTL